MATIVCTTSSALQISVALSGGAAVSIYSENEYESYDIDFIPIGLARRVDQGMLLLGFVKQGRHWRHQYSPHFVAFSAGPVAIRDEAIHDFAERQYPEGVLRILHPTECVMDRLAWFIHHADQQCFEQALQVVRRQSIDLERIQRWARKERPHGEARFREFERRLRERDRESLPDSRIGGRRGNRSRRQST